MKKQEFSLDSISLRGTLRQILSNWWVIVCLSLAAFFGATGLGMLTYVPQYTATSTLVIRVRGADAYNTLAQTTQMTAVYREVFQSTALRNMISNSIGEEVVGSISCSQISETNLLVLRATSPTPRQAYLFIHSALQNYEQVAGFVFSNASLEIVQEPSVPEEPSNASFLITHRIEITALAAFGAMLLITLIYMLRNTVKVAAKAPDLLDGRVLGTVPFEKKQLAGGKRTAKSKRAQALLISSPLASMNFAEANRRTATRLEGHLQHKQYQVLLMASVEENEGKSTLAANIAISLAEHGKRVVLIDGDFRKPAQYKIFDRHDAKCPSFSDVVAGKLTWNQAAVHNEKSNFFELFQFKTLKNPAALLNSQKLSDLIDLLRREVDYIIVDCSPVAVAADAELWMHHVDTVALVVRQDRADIRVINDTVDLIWKATGDFSGFILNAFHEERPHADQRDRYGGY